MRKSFILKFVVRVVVMYAVCFVLLACSESAHSDDDDSGDAGGTGGAGAAGEGGTASGGGAGALGGAAGSAGKIVPVGGTGGASATGGSGAQGTYPEPDTDDDGIPDDSEIARGTNPLEKDSDGDGCDDLLESAFGDDCDLDTTAALHACQGELLLTLTMAEGTGRRMSDLTTDIVPISGNAEDLWAQATEIEPADAGDIGELFELVSVEPSARVGYRVIPNVVFKWLGVRSWGIRVSSAEGGELAYGRMLWHRHHCPPDIE